MPRPTTSLVAGAFASLLAMSIALVMLSGVTAHAVGECVTTPNLQSQQSGHWYYRVDRATNRRCWFVGQPGTKVHHAPKLKPQPQSSPKPIRQATQVPVPVPAPVRTVAAARTDGDGFLTRWFGDPKPAGSDAAQAQQPVTIGPAARGETEVDEDADPSLTSDMPSVWPVHTAAELAAVSAPPASSFTLAHILAPMAAALALAAI